MTIEQLRHILHAAPVKPFTIHLADGRQIRVPHPDFLAQSPSGRTVLIYLEDETFSIIDLLLVTELKVHNGAAAGSKKKKV
jgi:hypothetical protein